MQSRILEVLARGFCHWIGACPNGGSTNSGEPAEEQQLLQKLHLALDRALRRPPVVVEHWEAGASSSSMGRGQVIPVQIL